jgi:4'-phosphopantetheinyl transferase
MDSPRRIVESAIDLPATHEIHVWQTQLDIPASDVSRLSETLSADERDRAARFYFEKHRWRFVVGRGTLRTIIGSYLQVAPDKVRFTYNDKGKPSLVEPNVDGFEFNVSHSHELALYAFALGVSIGVDVEVIRPVNDMEALAKRFFSPLEYEMLQRVTPENRLEAFFNCWTRKEAYVKAEGLGLFIPLDSFTVSLTPSQPARFIQLTAQANHNEAWSLHHLHPGPGAVGAVAIPSLSRQVVHREFSHSARR